MIHRLKLFAVAGAALLAAACGGTAPTPSAPAPEQAPAAAEAAVRKDLKYVVVDVDANELRFMDGDRVLWRAPVGTGTGFRLSTPGKRWEFTTPSGTMYVQYKALNPPWFIPDWWYHENDLPVPPPESPARKQEGGLGAAGVFLGNEIAIHGTDKPELLGRRVSHGCIRLSNANAVRLFHNVQVGTPVMIVGRQDVVGEMPDSAAAFTRSTRRVRRPADPLARVGTQTLLTRLDRELADAGDDSTWVALAGALVERGLAEDAIALRGVLQRADDAPSPSRRAEYGTFLADAFSRGALRTVVSLNRIPEASREKAVAAIVEATMSLYHGRLDAPLAPWPTRRVPIGRLGPEGQAGWTALQAAEAAYRERWGVRRSAAVGAR